MFQDTASALFGVEGLRVTGAQAGPGGALEVWEVTDWPGAAACPDCGTLSDRPHETVLARPRDARRAGDPAGLRWVKRRRIRAVVQLAVKAAGDVRRRAVREKCGRRGRSGDPEYGIKSLLARNLEHLTPGQFAKVIDTLDADATGQQIALAWIAKEKLRNVLNLRSRVTGSAPCERQVRDRLFAFCDWCARHEAIPELLDRFIPSFPRSTGLCPAISPPPGALAMQSSIPA